MQPPPFSGMRELKLSHAKIVIIQQFVEGLNHPKYK
jgi:hypothetical protein